MDHGNRSRFTYKGVVVFFILCSWFGIAVAQNDELPFCMREQDIKAPRTFVTSIYGYTVTFQWRAGQDDFCLAYRNQEGSNFIMEFLPRGQTLKNWRSMFSIQGLYKIQAPDEVFSRKFTFEPPNPLGCTTTSVKVLQRDMDILEYVKACGSYSNQQLTSGKKVGEITHILIRRVGGNTYSFWFSERMQPFDAAHYKFAEEGTIKEQSKFLNAIQLLPETQKR